MHSAIRVLLADDHPSLRMGLRVLLEQERDIAVVAEAGDGREALKQIESLCPDVAVLDCQLPVMNGVAVAMHIQQRALPTRVLALSAYADEQYVRGMIAAKAVGYLLKDEAPSVIIAAVRAAARGEGWFSANVAAQIAEWANENQETRRDLSEREWNVLHRVAAGKSNKVIARELHIVERTVEFHLNNIFKKLQVSSRLEAALWAKEHGIKF